MTSLPPLSEPITSFEPLTSLPPLSKPIEDPDEKAEELNIREGTLQMLPVKLTRNIGEVAHGDDTFEYLKCSWYTDHKVLRIATIGDNNCFFHSILKCFYPDYQENNEAIFRINLVQRFRSDLSTNANDSVKKELLSIFDVGDETYKYVSETLGVNIHILQGTKEDLYPKMDINKGNNRSIVIVGNKYHYEVVAIDIPGKGFQTVFLSTHPFIASLLRK